MKIVEFNGLPGSGKTTISYELFNLYKVNREDVATYDNLRERVPRRPFYAVPYMLKNYSFHEIFLMLKMVSCFKGVPLKEYLRRILYTEQIAYNYRMIEAKPGICIVDQGLIQGVISLGYVYSFKEECCKIRWERYVRKFLFRYRDNILYVNVELLPEDAQARIEARSGHDKDRFDNVTDKNELFRMLMVQKERFDILHNLLRGESQMIFLNGSNGAMDNAHILKDGIENDFIK